MYSSNSRSFEEKSNFIKIKLEIYSRDRENRAIVNAFPSVPVSRSVTEMRRFKVSLVFKMAGRFGMRPIFLLGNVHCFQESRLSLICSLR